MKSIGEINGRIFDLRRELEHCDEENLKVIQGMIKELKWVLYDRKGAA